MGTDSTTQEITAFTDQDAGWTTTIGSGSDPTMNLANNNDSDLGNFLGRPIRLFDYSWSVGAPLFERFNPWDLFLNNARVREKLANFELYRSKLHVKMVVSGTGFHYGRALVSYNPLKGFDEVTVQRNFIQSDLVAASQKPHFFLNPTNNAGGQLDLPFFWQENYLSLTRPDAADMGEITIKSFTDLQHANGGTSNVTITVYAWASDVVLTMPTSANTLSSLDYTPQSGRMNSGDEYGKGIISKPASAISHAAGLVTNVPMIAPYARATQMIANGVGELATHWGYSRPPIISDTIRIKPDPTGNMANTDAAEALTKLSLDSKQEITIDSRTVGLDGEDQMDIVRFCKRESYLDTFAMDETKVPDTLLWNCKVTPNLYRTEDREIHPTPMALMNIPFNRWQGSIRYRFQIVKSAFHKGRILVRWDPRANGANVEYNTVYSRVVDLAEEEDFEITIGWGQQQPFLKSGLMVHTAENFTTGSRFPADSFESVNGVLEIAVLNELVSPALSSPIQFNVFVAACDDIKFGDPSGTKMKSFTIFPILPPTPPLATIYEPQSGEVEAMAEGTNSPDVDTPVGAAPIAPIAAPCEVSDQTMNVFFGESYTSLRQLFRRYIKHRTYVVLPTANPNDLLQTVITEPGLGYWPGWDPNGIDVEQSFPCNVTVPTFAQFFMTCYAAWRGSTRAKYTFGGDVGKTPSITRGGFQYSKTTTSVPTTDAATLEKNLSYRNINRASAGTAITNIGINDTIEVEFPYYQGKRFTTARLPSSDFSNGAEGPIIDFLHDAEATYGVAINSWKSVGEDFTLFFFTGTPILYRTEVVPAL